MSIKLSKTHLTTWRLFITSHAKLINKIDSDLQEAGQIPLHWYDVLIELQEAENNRLRMADIADRVVLSRSGLTRLVDRLEKEGYIVREIDPNDRRGFFAILTEDGDNALQSAWEVYRDSIATLFAQFFTLEDTKTMQIILNKVVNNLE